MAVLVFYNPSNPNEYLCVAGAIHRVAAGMKGDIQERPSYKAIRLRS